jgi:hypothetical protein
MSRRNDGYLDLGIRVAIDTSVSNEAYTRIHEALIDDLGGLVDQMVDRAGDTIYRTFASSNVGHDFVKVVPLEDD